MTIGHPPGPLLARLAPVLLVAGAWLALALSHGAFSGTVRAGPGVGPGSLWAEPWSFCGPALSGLIATRFHAVVMDLGMVAAMMLPCALPAWYGLFALGDWRGAYGFLAGYGALWAAIVLGAAALRAALGAGDPPGLGFVAVLVTAVILSKAAAVRAGLPGRGPAEAVLPALGVPPGRPVIAGLAHARACLAADALPMAALALTAGLAPRLDFAAMLAATAAMLALRASAADPFRLATCPKPASRATRGPALCDARHPPNG